MLFSENTSFYETLLFWLKKKKKNTHAGFSLLIAGRTKTRAKTAPAFNMIPMDQLILFEEI